MPRFRFALSDDPQAAPRDTRVVVRQRFGWVALLGAFAALLCLPDYRHAMSDQATRVVTNRQPVWLDASIRNIAVAGAQPAGARYRERLQAVLARHPDDVELHLGGLVGLAKGPVHNPDFYGSESIRREGFRWAPLDYLADLRQRFPNSAAVRATELRYHCSGYLLMVRRVKGDKRGTQRDRYLTPEAVQHLLDLATEGEALEPGNSYFALIAASALVAGGRDGEARKALRRAASCSSYREYSLLEGTGGRRLLIEAYGDRGIWMHLLPSASVVLPHFTQFRQAARVLADQADDDADGVGLRADLVRVGATMREGSETLIGRLVGAAMAETGFAAEDDGRRGLRDHRAQAAAARSALVERARRVAPEHAAVLEREAERQAEFKAWKDSDAVFGERWNRLVWPAIHRELGSLHLLGNLLGCLAAWLLATLLLPGARRITGLIQGSTDGKPGLTGLRRACLLTAAAFATMVSTVVAMIWLNATPDYQMTVGGAVFLFGSLFGLLPFLHRTRTSATWGVGLVAALCSLAALSTLAGIWPWEFASQARGYWSGPQYGMVVGEWPENSGTNPLGTQLLPGPAPLLIAAMIIVTLVAAMRRCALDGWLEGLRAVVRPLCAALAVAYLGYTLFAVPATLRDGPAADRMIQAEAQDLR